MKRRMLSCGPALLLLLTPGCVERIVKIDTRPTGATVIVNDEEVGLSPVKFSYLWYGDYDLILRKEGYQTQKTHFRVDPPWYQWPGIDLVSETLVVGTIRDERALPPFELTPAQTPSIDELLGRAAAMRDDAAGVRREEDVVGPGYTPPGGATPPESPTEEAAASPAPPPSTEPQPSHEASGVEEMREVSAEENP